MFLNFLMPLNLKYDGSLEYIFMYKNRTLIARFKDIYIYLHQLAKWLICSKVTWRAFKVSIFISKSKLKPL